MTEATTPPVDTLDACSEAVIALLGALDTAERFEPHAVPKLLRALREARDCRDWLKDRRERDAIVKDDADALKPRRVDADDITPRASMLLGLKRALHDISMEAKDYKP